MIKKWLLLVSIFMGTMISFYSEVRGEREDENSHSLLQGPTLSNEDQEGLQQSRNMLYTSGMRILTRSQRAAALLFAAAEQMGHEGARYQLNELRGRLGQETVNVWINRLTNSSLQ